MNGELKEFCVICLSACCVNSVYVTVLTDLTESQEYILPTTNYRVTVKVGEDNISRIVAGYPGHLVDLVRAIGREHVIRVLMNQNMVGVWAQTEWFGLRVCTQHLGEAQRLWERGGNRNWSP